MLDGSEYGVLASEWPKNTVSLEAIERALYALADRATGTIGDGGSVWTVHLRARARIDADVLAHALRQEVNDQALRLTIAARTDSIRNLVFALAFSRSGLVEGGAEA